MRKLGMAMAAVTEVIVYSLSGFAIGFYLDRWIKKTNPWLTVLFTFVGLTGGFFRLYRILTRDDDTSGTDGNDSGKSA